LFLNKLGVILVKQSHLCCTVKNVFFCVKRLCGSYESEVQTKASLYLMDCSKLLEILFSGVLYWQVFSLSVTWIQ